MEIQESLIVDIEKIKKRMVTGVITLTARTFFIQLFSFAATFVLTIILEPNAFGIFFVVSAVLNLLIYFSDIGLAAALIQKKEKLTQKDLSTTFLIQQIIVVTLVISGLFASGIIAKFYKLDAAGIFLLQALIISLFLSSLKTIPSILLERDLNFSKLVIPQIVETVIFYSVAIFLALKSFGVESFAWASILRGVTGLIAMYIIRPWMPTIQFDKHSAKNLIKFGIPFQTNSILALVKDDLVTVFLGKFLTFSQVGYVGWGQKWSFIPLRFFMDSVNKVTFPAYSRLQDHKEELAKAIEKSIFMVTFFVYPTLALVASVLPIIVNLIPNYDKWTPAIPLIYLFCINASFSAVSTTFTNVLFSIGKPKIVLYFMIFWTLLTWVLIYPMVQIFSYFGVAITSAIVASTSLGTIYFSNKEVKAKIGLNVIGPLVNSLLMFAMIVGLLNIMGTSIINLTIAVTCGTILYACASYLMFKNEIIKNVLFMAKTFTNKQ